MNWLVESAVSELDRQDNGPMYLGERRLLRAIFDRPLLEAFGDDYDGDPEDSGEPDGEGDVPEFEDRSERDPVEAAARAENKGQPTVALGSGTDMAVKGLKHAAESDPQLKACSAIIVSQARRATSTFPVEKRDEIMGDLIAAGKTAVYKYKDRYDPNRGASFTTFMFPFISGEIKRVMEKIYDALKHEVSETDMNPNIGRGGSDDTDEENVAFDLLASNMNNGQLDEIGASSGFTKPDEGMDREDMHNEVAELFQRVKLTQNEKDVLFNVLMGGVSGVDYARMRGVSKQAVDKAGKTAIAKIQKYLRFHPEFRSALDALPR